ncbi:MAG TPA: chitobiase/beta-hexosaminidase C-terminal domain-containing protein [Thermoanaerobaculia bacterium]|nr:chitobiase/beta-hexosaminidase C-terminal domain-containing protein [Thermoanaerobaculia bacterium]
MRNGKQQELTTMRFRTPVFLLMLATAAVAHAATVAKPAISPNAGTYVDSVKVTIKSNTSNAKIRVTTNGKEPTASSPLYDGSFNVKSTTTVKAKAFKSGMTASATTTSKYTIAAAKPLFNPESGTYVDSVKVTIKTSTSGATIRYDTTGKEPTGSSPVHNGTLTFTSSVTLTAKAFKNGLADSASATAKYTVVKKVAAPNIAPGSGSYVNAVKVTITTATSGATIRYDASGKEPTSKSAVYSAPLTFTSNVTLKAKAFKSGMNESATASVSYNIGVPTLSSVKFTAIDSPLTTNPNAGGGQRMFAEARSAKDTVDRRMVRVVARVKNAGKGVPVYFRVFDPDDPSDEKIVHKGRDNKSYTSEATDLDKDANGNDNRPDGSSTPIQGSLNGTSATTDAHGEASVLLTVSRQPGNNFIATASLESAYSNGLRLRSGNGSVVEDSSGNKLPTSRAVKTDLLTVWRTVHLEADRMDKVNGNVVRGTIKAVKAGSSANTTEVTIPNIPSPGLTGKAGLADRFANGRFRANGGAYLTVRSNTANLIASDVVIVNGNVDASIVGKSFELEDDDYVGYPEGAALLDPATKRLSDYFRQAYVEVTSDLSNPNPIAPFKPNSDTSLFGNYPSDYKYDSRRAASFDFWQVYVLAAFQPYETADGDPNSERVTLGIVDDLGRSGSGAHIFQEPMRESGEAEYETVVHEVGHLFGCEHSDLGIMEQTGEPKHSTKWTNVSLAKIRTIQKR